MDRARLHPVILGLWLSGCLALEPAVHGGGTMLTTPTLVWTDLGHRTGALLFEPGASSEVLGAYGNVLMRHGATSTVLWEGARFRHHLERGPEGSVFLDHVQWAPSSEPVVRSPLLEGEPDRGYEVTESIVTADGRILAATIHWRSPRGMPTRAPDGERTYRYARPNEADGPEDSLRVMRVDGGAEVLRLEGQFGKLARSGSRIAAGMAWSPEGRGVLVVDGETGRHRFLEGSQDVTAGWIAFAPDGSSLVHVGFEGPLVRWTGPDLDAMTRVSFDRGDATVRSIAVHPSGLVFVGRSDGGMALVEPDTGKVHAWSIPGDTSRSDPDREISAAAFSDDGTHLATAHGGVGAEVRLWQITSP